VRDICREARVNLALVNYHFGDKHGLYTEIVNEAITCLSDFNSVAMEAPEGSSAEEKLRHFVTVFVGRLFDAPTPDNWIHKLMQHEISRPTDAASRIGQLAVAPRIRYLASIVTELLGVPISDPRVIQTVTSVHGLCLVYARMVRMPAPFRTMIPELGTIDRLDARSATEHVTAFSLAGIRAMRPAAKS
jgi:AcrR family transcriptional regulator